MIPPVVRYLNVVMSAVMNALVVCWREDRPKDFPTSDVVLPAGGAGSPLLFSRSSPEKLSAVECESGWSPVYPGDKRIRQLFSAAAAPLW